MSVSQERKEAAGHRKTFRPESAANSSVQPNNKITHSDGKPAFPVPSCVSIKSDCSMPEPPNVSSVIDPSRVKPHTHRSVSPVPSCVSMRSDHSMPEPPNVSSGRESSGVKPHTHRPVSSVPFSVSMKSDHSMPEPPNFNNETDSSGVNEIRADLTQSRCGVCEQVLKDPVITTTCGHSFCRQCISSYWEQPGPPGDQACPQCGETCRTQPPLKPPLDDEHKDRAGSSRDLHTQQTGNRGGKLYHDLNSVLKNHKGSLKKKFESISEDIVKPGPKILFKDLYTQPWITEGESEGVNKEHEIWQVESASRTPTTEDTPINCNDIFKPLPGQERHIRTVMTKGVAGIGKTVLVQKFILDWIEGEANENIDFIFPLSFRELNLIRNYQYSLHSLLLDFHPELKALKDSIDYKDCKVLFIFDGLDESRFTLDSGQNSKVSDLKQTSSVDALIIGLIQGTLLPSALIWITSRPAATSQIPFQYIDQVTEVHGFNDPQKEEYFRKRISDENKANRIISHIKASRSLHIMCHIPVFCSITATVLQQMLQQGNTQAIPKTLTEMFIHFLLIQTTRKNQKYQGGNEMDKEKPPEYLILKLAELAFKNLENGNLMFYEEDLKECGIDIRHAIVYSGLCTEIFKEESVIHQKKVYSFVHLSIQEFLAAVFVFQCYVTENHETIQFLLSQKHKVDQRSYILSFILWVLGLQSQDNLHVLLKSAVDEALKSKNGHLDLFLRFLMGISLESNQILLHDLLNQIHSSSKSIKETCMYIKKLNTEDLSPERCINLFHCLLEMNDHSMHQEIQKFLSSPKNIKQKLSPAHCSALAHMLLMSGEVLDEFDLNKYNTSDEGRRRLIPAVRCCRKACLAECNLTDTSCEILASVLQSPNSLIELDLSDNVLGDSGVQLLSKGLSNSRSKLQTLSLADCNLTDRSCEIVASVLQSPNSLIELDLSDNVLGDSGVQLLSKGLSNPRSKLQTVRLSDCLISEKSCVHLASALTSNPSFLKELDLSYNHPGDLGLNLLSARLEDPVSNLQTLKIDHASISRARQRLMRYACELTLDPNTAGRRLSLSEGNSRVTYMYEKQPYPDHPERFGWWWQVLCREGLSGRCYWEAEWSGNASHIAMAYKSIKRKVKNDTTLLGCNKKSWSLFCTSVSFAARHNNKGTDIPAPSSGSRRVGVFLDWPAGTLSFYSVSSDTLTHLHTFNSTFTEPLYPGFRVWSCSSVSLCQIT